MLGFILAILRDCDKRFKIDNIKESEQARTATQYRKSRLQNAQTQRKPLRIAFSVRLRKPTEANKDNNLGRVYLPSLYLY